MPMHEKIARYFEGKEQFYPAALEAKYSRIFNRIMDLWEMEELEEYFSELMVDKRGGRQGFPPDVLNDILTLSRIHGRILELKAPKRDDDDPWASDIARRSLQAEQIEFNVKGFERAIQVGNERAVKLFLKAGVKPNEKDASGSTPLLRAAALNRTSVAAVLIGAKADINVHDPQGFTPLHWAAFKGFPEMTKLLVERGADVNAKSNMGLTPIMQATMWGHDRIVSYLLSKGAPANETDNDGLTALHTAVSDGHVKVVKALMAGGADPNAKSAKGLTPAAIAQKKNNPEILAALSAQPSAADK
ncbi:MAG: ankyrin repeat domain-containing protein [Betaproteobacteria bacterium]|nr:ankyrin repeat domain-containing protein [Betaproteobacteria bacterium]